MLPVDQEIQRQNDLLACGILDTPPEKEFDALVKLASQICGTHISQINFVDANRQWNKATRPDTPKELPRGGSFCSTTILQDKWMIVEDASKDPRFNQFPFVKDKPSVRFYAGVNVKSVNGHNIGTICVLDFQPRKLEDWQLESLKTLAEAVQSRLEVRKKNEELKRQATFLENSADLIFMIDPDNYKITRMNENVINILGYTSEEITGLSMKEVSSNTVGLRKQLDKWKKSGKTIYCGEIELQHKTGRPVWLRLDMTNKSNEWYGTARDITKRKLQEIQIKKSLEEKNVLLAEIHHRVKNNLAIISAMLELEVFNSENEHTRNVLQNSQLRIRSMASIHELLYQAGDFHEVPFSSFVNNLFDNLDRIYGLKQKGIELNASLDNISLNVNQAIPMALIINELVTNAAKHAFKGCDSGKIKVGLKEDRGLVHLTVEDNGIGMEEGFCPTEQDSIGFMLVNILSQQLEGELTTEQKNGTSFTLSLAREMDRTTNTWLALGDVA